MTKELLPTYQCNDYTREKCSEKIGECKSRVRQYETESIGMAISVKTSILDTARKAAETREAFRINESNVGSVALQAGYEAAANRVFEDNLIAAEIVCAGTSLMLKRCTARVL